jgi:hypothetical protein
MKAKQTRPSAFVMRRALYKVCASSRAASFPGFVHARRAELAKQLASSQTGYWCFA